MARSVRSALLLALAVVALSIPVAQAQSTAARGGGRPQGGHARRPADRQPVRDLLRVGLEVTTIQYDMLLKFGSEDLSAQPSLAEGLRARTRTTWSGPAPSVRG